MKDLGLLKFDEPALRYFPQGIVRGSDGEKMSKSRGNVVEPLEMIQKYGADSLRLYLVSNSSPDKDFDWDDKGIQGSFKFLNKVYDYFDNLKFGKADPMIDSKFNKTLKELNILVENFKHNLAVIKIRNLFSIFIGKNIDKKTSENFLKILHIYCPFITEELWQKMGHKNFIDFESWPNVEEKKINDQFEKQEEMKESLIKDIANIKKITGKNNAKVYVYVLPNELEIYKNIEGINLFAVNDKNKYDPENKSKKVKPNRPGIYLE